MDRGGYDEAESALHSALRINPQFALARSNMGLLLGKLQRYDEGFRYHREALRMDPQNPEYRRNCASSHCDFGIALESKGQLVEAVVEFQSASSVDAVFWQAYFNLAVAYERVHRLDAAIDAYEKTIAANPACAEAQNDLGALLAKMGRVGEASGHFRAALRIRPDYREAEDNLSLSSAASGDPGIR
jgi:tetratricopeptide (TPR) repeat protein